MSVLEIIGIRNNKFSHAARRVFQEPYTDMDDLIKRYAQYLIEEDLHVQDDYAKKEFQCIVEALTRKEKGYPTPGFYNGEAISFESGEAPTILDVTEKISEADTFIPAVKEVVTEVPSKEEVLPDFQLDDFSLEDEPKQEVQEEVKEEPAKLSALEEFEMNSAIIISDFSL